MASDPKPPRRGTKALLTASGVAQICALARYMVLARVLGPEQLGLAAIIILTSQFFESVTDAGSDRFLVQDRAGNDPALMRLTHLVSLGRGALVAAALVLFAGPIADLSGAPHIARDMMVLAIAPLIMGLVHWDFRRQQRESDFLGESRMIVVAEVASLIVTLAAVLILHNFTAILYGIITRALVTVMMSHAVAQRRYAIGPAREYLPRLARFGWPLMVNGLLIFIGGQGDRLFISNQLGVTELGHYSAVMLLIFYPSGMLMRFMMTMYLPRMSVRQSDPVSWARAHDALASQSLLLALAMQFGFVLVAPFAVPLLYGSQFAMGWLAITLIAILQSARFVRMWPVTAAMGEGQNHIVMVNNSVRMIAFPLAVAGLILLGGIEGIIIGFILGEWLAFVTGLVMTNGVLGQRPLEGGGRLLHVLASALLLGLFVLAFERGWMVVMAVTGALTVGWAILFIRSEWKALMDLLALADRATSHRIVPRWMIPPVR